MSPKGLHLKMALHSSIPDTNVKKWENGSIQELYLFSTTKYVFMKITIENL